MQNKLKPGSSSGIVKDNNFKLGLASFICGYSALIAYILVIFIGPVFKVNTVFFKNYTTVVLPLLVILVLAAGVIFIVSIIRNIKEKVTTKKFSTGLIITIISLPPVFLVYLAFLVKVLTENH